MVVSETGSDPDSLLLIIWNVCDKWRMASLGSSCLTTRLLRAITDVATALWKSMVVLNFNRRIMLKASRRLYPHALSRNMNWTHIEVESPLESMALLSVESNRGPLMNEKAGYYSIRIRHLQI